MRRRFVLRTIRNGAVKIRGVVFVPGEHFRKYDGRLDGQRFAFGLYWGPPNYDRYDAQGWNRRDVVLWGSEAAYRAKTDEEHAALWPGPNCVDGHFPWEWWYARDGGDPAPGYHSPDGVTLQPPGSSSR